MSFVSRYFDGKPLAELKKTITPSWSDENIKSHLDLIQVPSDATKILEVGSGIGRLLKAISSPTVKCIGYDASADMCREAATYLAGSNAEVRLCPGDGTLVATPGVFDFAFCFTVFQHIPDTKAVTRYLQSMVKALHPGGVLVAQFLNRHMAREGQPLWTYHDLDKIRDSLRGMGTSPFEEDTVTKNWTVLRYTKGAGGDI